MKNPKERMAELLLEELKTGEEGWYYISVVHCPTNTFRCGLVVPGKGPTDAWHRAHGLNLIDRDCETRTSPEIPAEAMAKIPPEKRMVKITSREECEKLGS